MNNVQNIDALEGMGLLYDLDLGGCEQLRNIIGVKNLSLVALDLAECSSLEDLDALEGMNTLIELDASKCRNLKNLHGIEGLPELMRLDVSGCRKLSAKSIEGVKATLPAWEPTAPRLRLKEEIVETLHTPELLPSSSVKSP